MLQTAGILAILIAAIWVVSNVHGADVDKQLIDPSAFAFLFKYPIIWAQALGSFVGACIAAYFQKAERFPKFLISFVIGMILSPIFFRFTEIKPEIDTAMACGLGIGMIIWLVLEIIYSREIRASIQHGVAHQIDKRLGDGKAHQDQTNEP